MAGRIDRADLLAALVGVADVQHPGVGVHSDLGGVGGDRDLVEVAAGGDVDHLDDLCVIRGYPPAARTGQDERLPRHRIHGDAQGQPVRGMVSAICATGKRVRVTVFSPSAVGREGVAAPVEVGSGASRTRRRWGPTARPSRTRPAGSSPRRSPARAQPQPARHTSSMLPRLRRRQGPAVLVPGQTGAHRGAIVGPWGSPAVPGSSPDVGTPIVGDGQRGAPGAGRVPGSVGGGPGDARPPASPWRRLRCASRRRLAPTRTAHPAGRWSRARPTRPTAPRAGRRRRPGCR